MRGTTKDPKKHEKTGQETKRSAREIMRVINRKERKETQIGRVRDWKQNFTADGAEVEARISTRRTRFCGGFLLTSAWSVGNVFGLSDASVAQLAEQLTLNLNQVSYCFLSI
jgi:hypothetical protein